MKIYRLKEELEDLLRCLDDFDEEAEIHLSPNTYGIHGTFIGFSGYDGGYLDLDNLEDSIEEKEE